MPVDLPMKRAAPAESEGDQQPTKKQKVSTSSSLEILLDVTKLQTLRELEDRFVTIANELCNRSLLRLYTGSDDSKFVDYNVLELEFYLIKQGHEDPFTHGSDDQKVAGNWYFHKAPTRSGAAAPKSNTSRAPTAAGGYRGGTRKGLDLTFGGPPGSGAVGGILLRTLRRVSPDDKLISGPSLLVDELLAQSGATNIAALVASWSTLRAFPCAAEGARMVVESRKDAGLPVYSTPRIGLDLYKAVAPAAADDPRAVFVARPYRYIVQPDLLTANGRMQTFVGLYEGLLDNTNPQRSLAKACDLSGIKVKTGEEYAQSYRSGKKSGNVKKFVGVKTATPKAYIEMVGALRTFLSPPSDAQPNGGD